jgi:hypothetical protein
MIGQMDGNVKYLVTTIRANLQHSQAALDAAIIDTDRDAPQQIRRGTSA